MPSIKQPLVEHDQLPNIDTPMSYTPTFRGSDLRGADMRSAVLDGSLFTGSTFRGANFTRVDFTGAIFNNCKFDSAVIDGEAVEKKHVVLHGLRHLVLITPTSMFIGCMHYTHDEWREMPLNSILALDEGAAEIWATWKTALLAVCDTLATGII